MLRNLFERVAERYYEGPSLPQRYPEQVVAFAKCNPNATVEQWAQFSSNLARNAYQSGYVRGFEWAERDLDRLQPGDPELLREQNEHDWSWHAPEHLTSDELKQEVTGDFLERLPDDEARARYLDMLGHYYGGFRVIVARTK